MPMLLSCQAAIESACVDGTHLRSAVFYDSDHLMLEEAAEA